MVIGVVALAAVALVAPVMDPHNIPIADWDKGRWERAMTRLERKVPAGTALLADRESLHMMKARWLPRERRGILIRRVGEVRFKGHVLVEAESFDWRGMQAAEILALAPAGPVWIADMGFDATSVKARERELGLTAMVDEPGVLYLGRLR